MNDLIVSDEQWIEIYCDLAVILAEEYGDGPLITEIAENGDERYTDESQDRFNNYCDEATSIMERIGFKRLNDEDEVDGIIQKNPGPGDDLLSEIDQTNEAYKTTRDPCARCGVYSFEGNVPFDEDGEEIGDRYYCLDCIDSVARQIEELKEDSQIKWQITFDSTEAWHTSDIPFGIETFDSESDAEKRGFDLEKEGGTGIKLTKFYGSSAIYIWHLENGEWK